MMKRDHRGALYISCLQSICFVRDEERGRYVKKSELDLASFTSESFCAESQWLSLDH